MPNIEYESDAKPRRRWCPLWLSERNTIIVLYNFPIFFVGIWLWALPLEIKCSHTRLIVLVNTIVTVTLCVWWPAGIDVYYGIPRPEPTTYERRRDFAVFAFALIVAAGLGYGMAPRCAWEVSAAWSHSQGIADAVPLSVLMDRRCHRASTQPVQGRSCHCSGSPSDTAPHA